MKLIPLSGERGRGMFAQVDDDKAELVARYTWYLYIGETGRHYAIANVPGTRGGPMIKLHQLIAGFPFVDHEDGDGLNCQQHNLRKATKSQNGANSGSRAGHLSTKASAGARPPASGTLRSLSTAATGTSATSPMKRRRRTPTMLRPWKPGGTTPGLTSRLSCGNLRADASQDAGRAAIAALPGPGPPTSGWGRSVPVVKGGTSASSPTRRTRPGLMMRRRRRSGASPANFLAERARRRAERRATIVPLRAEGLTLEQIGDQLGITRQAAWQHLKQAAQ